MSKSSTLSPDRRITIEQSKIMRKFIEWTIHGEVEQALVDDRKHLIISTCCRGRVSEESNLTDALTVIERQRRQALKAFRNLVLSVCQWHLLLFNQFVDVKI